MKFFDRNSLVTRILVLFVLFNVISIVMFVLFIQQHDRKSASQSVDETIREMANEKAEIISITIDNLMHESKNLALWAIEYIDEEEKTTLSTEYAINEKGVLYRQKTLGENYTSVFFPADIPLDEENIRIINGTENMDKIFRIIAERSHYYQWLYIATEDGLLRIYPYSGIDMFEPNHQQKGDPFYVVANSENNPSRQTVITKPYVDYLGTGWMITCSSPLYRNNEFIGVACIDIRLDTLQEKLLKDFRLSNSGFVYLLDRGGEILYHPAFLPIGETQGQMHRKNVLTERTITGNYREALSKMLNDGTEGIVSYQEKNNQSKERLIAYAPVEGLGWMVAVEIDYDDFFATVLLEPSGLFVYIIIISVFLFIFALLLYRQYTKPILALEQNAKRIAAGDYTYQKSPSGFTEVQVLSDAFNKMANEIGDYTDSLIYKNKEIESVFNNLGGLLMIIDKNYKIRILNEKSKEKFCDGENIIGKECYSALLGETCVCCDCKVEEVIKTKKAGSCRMVIEDEIINNSYYPVLDENKEVIEVIVYSQRVTKSVLMEKELLQKEKLAGIGQISSAIAHELKTPLAVIKGAVYLLKAYTKDDNNSKVKENIQVIASEVEGAEKTIYNILDYSGKGKEGREVINVTKIVNQILFQRTRERVKRGIKSKILFEQNPLQYYGEIEPLKTVLQNIISNAINALDEGGEVIISGGNIDANTLRIEISDNGCGINEEAMKHIFKPFITGNISGKGTGLGLWITKMMVDRMKGDISIKSRVGEGTKVIIDLPKVHKEDGEDL